LSGADFILPELVGHDDNGDLQVAISESGQAKQVLWLQECGEQPAPEFRGLSFADQQLERRRFLDYLKRQPKKELDRIARKEQLQILLKRDEPEYAAKAEGIFIDWFNRKQRKRREPLTPGLPPSRPESLLSSFSQEGNMNEKWNAEVTVDQENMLRRVAEEAAKRLTPIEIHSICVLLSMAFGTGTIQSRIFAWYANEMRVDLGLPRLTDAVAGNPTMEEKMQILRSALEKAWR
jgi:hypothetical protein